MGDACMHLHRLSGRVVPREEGGSGREVGAREKQGREGGGVN
jgi:hypothetical protein